MKENPMACFAFHGQWDGKDVGNEATESQRFLLWRRIATNKINPKKYSFVISPRYNFFMAVPNVIYSESYHEQLYQYFSTRFKSDLNTFKVPTPEEFEKL